MNEQELLGTITDYYLNSGDFNGIPSHSIDAFEKSALLSLIEKDAVSILTNKDDTNIHINRRNRYSSKSDQIRAVETGEGFTAYPTPKYLSTLDIQENKPFTKMLAYGAEQFRVMYFAVDILELYVNNPLYTIIDLGYRSSISVETAEKVRTDLLHSEWIGDFGIAYPCQEQLDADRAIGVFLRDLSNLNYEAQCKWRGFLLPDQTSFRINAGFIKNLVYGEWITSYWIFDALLDEIKLINDMCVSIGIPPLFCKAFSRKNKELIGYRIVLIPTLKNYYEFVSAIEKIVVNNLNYATFQKSTPRIKPVGRKKNDGTLKRSIEMLEEWFSINYFAANPYGYEMFKQYISGTLRKVRKIRQVPAHELYDNRHDKSLYQKQNELIHEVYHTVRDLRIMLSRHPDARFVSVPDELKDEDNIVIY